MTLVVLRLEAGKTPPAASQFMGRRREPTSRLPFPPQRPRKGLPSETRRSRGDSPRDHVTRLRHVRPAETATPRGFAGPQRSAGGRSPRLGSQREPPARTVHSALNACSVFAVEVFVDLARATRGGVGPLLALVPPSSRPPRPMHLL